MMTHITDTAESKKTKERMAEQMESLSFPLSRKNSFYRQSKLSLRQDTSQKVRMMAVTETRAVAVSRTFMRLFREWIWSE